MVCEKEDKAGKNLLAVFIIAVFICLTASGALALEFLATSFTKTPWMTQTMKMYFKDKNMRMEAPGQTTYTIFREDKKVMWIVTPEDKSYTEVPLGSKEKPEVTEKFPGETDRKEVGTETIGGHPTKKYEITLRFEDKTEHVYQWIATDMNFPIKSSAVDGSWITEIEDIKIGPQPESLFDLPAGYKKIPMLMLPGMGEGSTPPPVKK